VTALLKTVKIRRAELQYLKKNSPFTENLSLYQ